MWIYIQRERADKNSVWQISNYTPTHQIRQTGQKGGGIALFVQNNFDFKIIKRGNVCNDDTEYLTMEILRNKDNNIIFPVFTGLREGILNFFG